MGFLFYLAWFLLAGFLAITVLGADKSKNAPTTAPVGADKSKSTPMAGFFASSHKRQRDQESRSLAEADVEAAAATGNHSDVSQLAAAKFARLPANGSTHTPHSPSIVEPSDQSVQEKDAHWSPTQPMETTHKPQFASTAHLPTMCEDDYLDIQEFQFKDTDSRNRMKNTTTQQRIDLHTHCLNPLPVFSAPLDGKQSGSTTSHPRHFQTQWLQTFPWLAYSISCDAVFCAHCLFFSGLEKSNGADLTRLTSGGFQNWKNLKRDCESHASSNQYHSRAVEAMGQMHREANGAAATRDISEVVESASRTVVMKNRTRFEAMYRPLIFLAKQGLGIRGHEEGDFSVHVQSSQDGSSEINPGNFIALLLLMDQQGCPDAKDIFGPRVGPAANQTWHSPSIQNEVIAIAARHITQDLITEIQHAGYFSVLADEAADSSRKSQMSVVIRFVDANMQIREEFMGFVELESWTGQGIADTLKNFLSTTLGLDLNLLRGQGYDGAGAMAGSSKGCAVLIQNEFPRAHFFHCAAHQVSLVIANALKTADVMILSRALELVDSLWLFFKDSPKRYQALKMMEELNMECTVKGYSPTRWVQRLEAISSFMGNYAPYTRFFDAVANSHPTLPPYWNVDTISKSSSLRGALQDFKMVYCIVALDAVLGQFHAITLALQKKDSDIIAAFKHVTTLKTVLSDLRRDIDTNHDGWYKDALALWHESKGDQPAAAAADAQGDASEAGQPGHGRGARRGCASVYKDNQPAESESEYMKRAVAIPMVERVISELGDRFGNLQETAIQGMLLIPSYFCPRPDILTLGESDKRRTRLHSIEKCASSFNIPSDMDINIVSLRSEVAQWESMFDHYYRETVAGGKSVPDTTRTLPRNLQQLLLFAHIPWVMYPQIEKLVRILATLPVTSCTCERSISQLRIVKSYLRSTMGQDRLTDLAMIYTHYDYCFDMGRIMNDFAAVNPLRAKTFLHRNL